ncbi:hypothetical protein, partial [Clostridium perfringens]
MHLNLIGCSNPGCSLTEFRKKQILELSDWIKKHKNDSDKTYKEIQKEVSKEYDDLDESKIRMLVPLLRKMGYVTDVGFNKKNSLISINNFFTEEGLNFIKFLKIIDDIQNINCDKNLNEKINVLNELFNIMSMLNLILNGENIYLDTINFLKLYKTMDKNEFFIMTTI